MFTQKLIDHIMRHTRTRKDGCITWNRRQKSKYGCIKFRGRSYDVPRVVLLHSMGLSESELRCYHTCGNDRCVNLEHMFLGKYQESPKYGRIRHS